MTYRIVTITNDWLDRLRAPAWVRPIPPVAMACGAVVAFDYLLPKYATVEAVFPLFLFIVFMSAFVGGAWVGIVATAIALALGSLGGPERGFSGIPGVIWFGILGAICSVAGSWDFKTRQSRNDSARLSEEREAHLQSIFDTAPEAMIVINETGIVQSYGAAAERMFQWRPNEVIRQNIKMLMPRSYGDEHDGYLQRYAKTKEQRIIGKGRIVTGQRKDGSTFPMHLAVGEVKSVHGKFFTGFVQDLTQQEQSEASFQQLRSELIHISRSNAMGEMASALAHELNQPLSAIANYLRGAERLLERTDVVDVRALDAIHKASDQALRAGDIIRKLRDYLARGEGERSVESLADVVHEACSLALVGAKEDGVDVRYQLDGHLDRVLVDRIQVQQVILNLIRNALEAMEEQPRRSLIIATSVGSNLATVSVTDTGTGVDETVAQNLFQPFVSSKPSGMGVGLSISRTIIESHGGQLWAEPNPGGGSSFRFTLNLARVGEGVH